MSRPSTFTSRRGADAHALCRFHSGDMDQTLLRYSHVRPFTRVLSSPRGVRSLTRPCLCCQYAGPAHEKRGPEDYLNQDLAATTTKRGGGAAAFSDEAEEEEESDDEKPHIAAGSSGVKVIPNAAKGKQALRAAAERRTKQGDRSRSLSEDQQLGQIAGALAPGMFDPGSGGADLAAAAAAASGTAAAANGFHNPPPPFNLNGFNFPPNGHPSSNMTQQPNGLPFSSAASFAFPNFAAAAAGGAGLPPPNFGFNVPGAASWPNPFGTPTSSQNQHQQQQQSGFQLPNGSSAGASAPSSSSMISGGVPSWFGASDPTTAALQTTRDQLAQLPPMQLLQQLSGMSAHLNSAGGWPGLANATPEAAMQAIQQQAQQAQHIFQQQQQHHYQHQQHHQQQGAASGQQYATHEPSPRSQPVAAHPQPSPSFRPTPAPMFGSPAASMAPTATAGSSHSHQQHGNPAPYALPTGSSSGGGGHDIARPESGASIRSSSHHPSPAGGGRPMPPGRESVGRQGSTDSMGYDRPRLQVAIPAEARPGENTKPGLVTAGGASMLGAGFSTRSSDLRDQPVNEQGGEEGDAQAGGEDVRTRSAFCCSTVPP